MNKLPRSKTAIEAYNFQNPVVEQGVNPEGETVKIPVIRYITQNGDAIRMQADVALWRLVDGDPRAGTPMRGFDAEDDRTIFRIRVGGTPERVQSIDRRPRNVLLPTRTGVNPEDSEKVEKIELDVHGATGSIKVIAVPIGTTGEMLDALLDTLAPLTEINPGDEILPGAFVDSVIGSRISITRPITASSGAPIEYPGRVLKARTKSRRPLESRRFFVQTCPCLRHKYL